MTARQYYAEEIEALCGFKTPGLTAALAALPRERFLGPGPWTVKGDGDMLGPARLTPDADPKRVYHNLAIAIDPARQLFNGQPSTLSSWIDGLRLRAGSRVLHVGCGTGYYSSVMGHIVGADGSVDAIEADRDLAARATEAVREWPWIHVQHGDGTTHGSPYDAILINAGMSHPRASWLAALAPEGRMMLPMTVTMGPGTIGKGFVVLLERDADGFAARIFNMVAIYQAQGIRDEALAMKFAKVMSRGDWMTLRRLRVDAHDEGDACWMHGPDFCFSR